MEYVTIGFYKITQHMPFSCNFLATHAPNTPFPKKLEHANGALCLRVGVEGLPLRQLQLQHSVGTQSFPCNLLLLPHEEESSQRHLFD